MSDTTKTAARGRKFQSPGHYTDKDREKIPDADFAGPDKSFPIVTQADVHDAARLIGHADDPEAVKRRVIAIAKRKGFSLPDSWQTEDSGESEERAALPVEHVLTAPITRVDPDQRLVTVTATSESVDSFGTVFDYDASKDAFVRWVGNVREMHQPKAVGTRVGVHFDDAERKVEATLRISRGAQDTWEKVLDGTLKGASIGASNVVWETGAARGDGGRNVPRARKYDLVELSLVDNPSNPDAVGISVVRNAVPDESVLDEVETVEEIAQRAASLTADPVAGLPPAVPAAGGEASVDLGPLSAPEEARGAAEGTTLVVDAATVVAAGQAMRNANRQPKPAYVEKLEADAIRAELADEVRRAGDVAANSVGPLMIGEDPMQWLARVADARGKAEQQVLLEQRARGGSKAKAKMKALPPASAAEAEEENTGNAKGAGSAPAADEGAGAGADEDMEERNAAIKPTASIPSDATSATSHSGDATGPALAEQANVRESAGDDVEQPGRDESGADAGTEMDGHAHEHEHRQSDGSYATHSHAHNHGAHGHGHSHVFRNGVAVTTRRLDQYGKSDGVSLADKRAPVSGSAQQGGPTESGLKKMTPAAVGSPVGYNTETVNAFGFGVPPREELGQVAAGDDDITLDESTFHPGGHGSAGGVGDMKTDGMEDEHAGGAAVDASRPPEPSRIPRTGKTPGEGNVPAGMRTGTSPRAKSVGAVNDSSDEPTHEPEGADEDEGEGYEEAEGNDSDADDVKIASRPSEPSAIKRDAGTGDDTVLPDPEMTLHPAFIGSIATADIERVGARISAGSREAVHGMRDTAQEAVRKACEHCNCADCQKLLAVMDGGTYDALGQHSGAAAETANTNSDTAMFGSLRLMQAELERAIAAQVATLSAAFEQRVQEIATAVSDAQLTLADYQRVQTANSTRALQQTMQQQFSQITARVEAVEHLPEQVNAFVTTAVQPMHQRLEAVAEVASGLKADVERIAAQPAPVAMAYGPRSGVSIAADKTLALHSTTRNGAGSGAELTPDLEAEVLRRMAAEKPHDTALVTSIAARLTQLANPSLR